MEQDFCLLMVLSTMPTAVVLSMRIGMGGCGCPNSVSVSRMIRACCALRNRAPNSASAAEAATMRRIVHNEWMAPFSLIGLFSMGHQPKK